MIRLISYLTIVLLTCSCMLEEHDMNMVGGEQIEFTSSKTRIITKGGDEAQTFETGTAFRLFAVTSGSDWSMNGTKFYNIEGIGEEDGKVGYSIDGKLASYDVGSNLDFYGVTYGSATAVPVNGTAGTAPTVPVSIHEGELPDLMYSDNLKNRNSSSGLLNLEFRHTLAKLKFEVLKQDESADIDKKLEKVVLKKVVLKGSAAEGEFNMKTSEWAYADADKADRTVFESNEGLKVEPTVSRLQENGKDIEMLVIPNSSQMSLAVTLDLDGDASTPDDKTVTYDLTSDENVPLKVEANHEYVLSIVILKNDVRIVTVTPKVYDWIDVNVDNSAYLGQPVFFGGLMWMDRNLGAQSADCENDWYNTIGHYYQFGRNIPFILDIQKWLAYTEDDGQKDLQKSRILKVETDRITDLHPGWNSYGQEKKDEILKNMLECIYTLNHKGERVYGYKRVSTSDDVLFRRLGEVIRDADGNVNDDLTTAAYRYGGGPDGTYQTLWTFKGNNGRDYWKSPEDQPCPRGWRLPTVEDLYTFMPRSQVNWNSSSNIYPKSMNSAQENIRYGYVNSPEGQYNVCYILKNPGTGSAYRIMIRSHFAKNADGNDYSTNKRYINISRYPAAKEDSINDYTSATLAEALKPESKENTKWNNPVETTSFPGCGYIVPDNHRIDLRSFGWGTIMRTSDYNSTAQNWVQYLSVTDYQLSIQGASRRSLGDQVRCVRDINAK